MSSVVAKHVGNMLCIKISKDRYLPFGTNPMKPPSGKCSSSSSRPVNKRAMLTLGGPSHAIASILDVILEEFFKAERSDSNEPSLEDELSKDYAETFLKHMS